MVLLEPWNTAFTSIEFDPTTSSLLGTYNVIGKTPEFGQVDLKTYLPNLFRELGLL